MDLGDLAGKAKEFAEEHLDEAKEHADELKDIATGDGSITDKAKAAVDELRSGNDAAAGS